MRNFILSALLTVVFSLQSTLALGGQNDQDRFEILALPLWLQFNLNDETTAFSFHLTDRADGVLAAYDKTNQLRISIPRGDGGGLILKPDLKIPFSPHLLVADVDGDLQPEVLVCSDKLRVYRVQKHGLSLLWTSQEEFEGNPSPKLALSDLDADGHIDIVLLNYLKKDHEGSSLYLYLNQKENAQFSLSGTTTFTDEHGYHSTSGIATADFSGDDRPDIVVGNSNGWMWLIETEDGKPLVKKSWKVPSGGAIGPGLSAGNMLEGPKQELLVGTNGGDIFVYQFSADGVPQVVAKTTAGRLSYGVHAADMDGDGLDEFLLSRGYSGYAGMTQKDVVTEIWKLNDGRLSTIWRKEATGFTSHAVMLQDLDRDGTPELVTYGKGKSIEAVKPLLDR